MTTARRKAVDRLRRDQASAAKLALTGGPPGPYGVEAAIAAPAQRGSGPRHYRRGAGGGPLQRAAYARTVPSPVVAVNRAVVVAMCDGPDAGLALLDKLAGEPLLRRCHPYLAARADLLHRLGRHRDAAAAYREAIALPGSEPERVLLRRKLAEVRP